MKNRPRYKHKMIHSIPRSKLENIGLPTGLLDCEGNQIFTGEVVYLISNPYYFGPVMWNRYQDEYGIFMGFQKYMDPFDTESYGKFIRIPSDNGMRMDIKKKG